MAKVTITIETDTDELVRGASRSVRSFSRVVAHELRARPEIQPLLAELMGTLMYGKQAGDKSEDDDDQTKNTECPEKETPVDASSASDL